MRRGSLLISIAALAVAPAIVLAAGHIVPGTFSATLTTDAEVPAPTVPDGYAGTGEATGTINLDDTIEIEVTFEGLTGDAVGAHIHWGPVGEPGPVIFPLDHTAGSPISQTLTPDDFAPAPGGPQTFEEAVEAMHAGNTYLNVHTEMNGPGEIRGQLRVVPDTATADEASSPAAGMPLMLLALAGLAGFLFALRRFSFRRA